MQLLTSETSLLETIDSWLGARLSGEPVELKESGENAFAALIADRVELHGIALALCESKVGLDGMSGLLCESIREEGRLQALWEEMHRRSLVALLDAFKQAGVRCLVFKGTGVAYSHYENPAVRRRGDCDILVCPNQVNEARAALARIGFACADDTNLGQETWIGDSGVGFVHSIDLHWEIINPIALRSIMDSRACFARSIPLDRLSPQARTLDPVFALLRGMINQALHGIDGYFVGSDRKYLDDRLIWRMDMHLLAQSLDDACWRELADIALTKGIGKSTAKYLKRAQASFGTQIPVWFLAKLGGSDGRDRIEEYVANPFGPGWFMENIRSAPNVRTALSFAARHLFPPRVNMRNRFPTKQSCPLPVLHIYRLVVGAVRLLSRPFRTDR